MVEKDAEELRRLAHSSYRPAQYLLLKQSISRFAVALRILPALWHTDSSHWFCFCCSALRAAHHGSNISYQLDKTITLEGIVTEWDYRNPHPQIYFDVKDKDGTVAHWATELLPTPLMLRNMNVGWSRDDDKTQRPHRPGLQPLESCGREGMPREGTDP